MCALYGARTREKLRQFLRQIKTTILLRVSAARKNTQFLITSYKKTQFPNKKKCIMANESTTNEMYRGRNSTPTSTNKLPSSTVDPVDETTAH